MPIFGMSDLKKNGNNGMHFVYETPQEEKLKFTSSNDRLFAFQQFISNFLDILNYSLILLGIANFLLFILFLAAIICYVRVVDKRNVIEKRLKKLNDIEIMK